MISIKTDGELKKMWVAGKILSSVAKEIIAKTEAGITLKSLDDTARKLIYKAGAKPAFLGYQPHGAKKPYPCTVCASVNEVVVHGVPGGYKLKSGDLLKLDFGVIYDGYHADAAWTIPIGEVSDQAEKLIETTRNALHLAVKQCKTGKNLGDIGYTIKNYVEKHGFKVIKGLTGHGIGKDLHEEPEIYNEGQKGQGIELQPGMVLAIEPMVSTGSSRVIQLKDDSWATADGSLSAHFEHTVAITDAGSEVLTLP